MNTPAWARPSDLAAMRERAAQWLSSGVPACVVEVVDVKGSAPREVGARMLVSPSEEAGTVGGGHLEHLATAVVREWLATSDTRPGAMFERPFERHFALGPSLGQCCGGAVALRFSRLDASALSDWPAIAPPLTQPHVLGAADQSYLPSLHIQLHGAGHVGRALVAALAPLPFTVQWVDERDEAFPVDPAWFAQHPRIERVATDVAESEVAAAPPNTVYLVLTHNHDLDLRIVHAILRRDDFAFCGLIGSKTKRERFKHRLAERGIGPAALARLTCPIGATSKTDRCADPRANLYAKWPEVIAAGVVQQLVVLAEHAATAIA